MIERLLMGWPYLLRLMKLGAVREILKRPSDYKLYDSSKVCLV